MTGDRAIRILPPHARSLVTSHWSRISAPMRTRTSNLLIRSQMLYPIELWALVPSGRRAGPEGAVI